MMSKILQEMILCLKHTHYLNLNAELHHKWMKLSGQGWKCADLQGRGQELRISLRKHSRRKKVSLTTFITILCIW